ncbi:O-antigen ligase family protein [Deinococcus frigens]|uniref:O-antigen ligase family protein n=1 Tax=Deinococcus frigens TaxID=249403 RepID=UPI001FDFAACD|nr:O-antigen ligase family protein [Deinococcus frigens]
MKSMPLRNPGAASPSPRIGWPVWLVLLVAALLVGLLAVKQPLLAGAVTVLVVLLAGVTRAWDRLSQLALGFIGVSLIGYAFLGKGYSYIGVAPLFVGELALALSLLALWRVGTVGIRHYRGLLALLGVFMLIGLISTVPYISLYKVDALRDSVIWLYAAFALIVAGLLLRLGWLEQVLKQYARLIPWFLFLAPLSLVLFKLFERVIPEWPGSGTPLLSPKAGDIGVHLAGIVAFLLLGLHQRFTAPGGRRGWQEWLWWGLLLVGCLAISPSRAALLAVLASGVFIILLRPRSGWGRPLYLVALILTLLVATNLKINLGGQRDISAEALVLNAQSIVGDSGSNSREGTRTWRLDWWNEIVDYTVYGPYFWTGKGYGINLANSDGFQVYSDNSLRNPHNGHLTFLARSGVPGFLAWVVLQLAFGFSLLRAYARARAARQTLWASLNLWIFAYWMAFLVNAAFDVYLEGPQGGIWFWCLFGFGLAVMEAQRRGVSLSETPVLSESALPPPTALPAPNLFKES